jgi:uncharacterized DUF497 family protein
MAVHARRSALPLQTAGVEWDQGNRDKCQKHGVSLSAIESLLQGAVFVQPDIAHSEREERFKAIGRANDGRAILIVFTLRKRAGRTFIRPISARDMHQREVISYEEEASKAADR